MCNINFPRTVFETKLVKILADVFRLILLRSDFLTNLLPIVLANGTLSDESINDLKYNSKSSLIQNSLLQNKI
jgi:hypothetical protein